MAPLSGAWRSFIPDAAPPSPQGAGLFYPAAQGKPSRLGADQLAGAVRGSPARRRRGGALVRARRLTRQFRRAHRSEEHTSELQSIMRISYAVFCLKKKTTN